MLALLNRQYCQPRIQQKLLNSQRITIIKSDTGINQCKIVKITVKKMHKSI